MMHSAFLVCHRLIDPIDGLHSILHIEMNIYPIHFFHGPEFLQLFPRPMIIYIVREQYPIVKREFFLRKNMNLILLVKLPVSVDKAECCCSCADNNGFMFDPAVGQYLNRRIFIVGLFGYWIYAVSGQVVGPGKIVLQDLSPMHGEKNYSFFDLVSNGGANPYLPSPALNNYGISFSNSPFFGIHGVDFQKRIRDMFVQSPDFAGAGHGVPLVPDSTRIQNQGKICTGRLFFARWS